ncbi:hypothetical protein GOBAR_AA36517 [Gossypium barbadense]|uniref:Uncharacterized protein n=1 Tax=Gossypium barbadense TaxID=3634 RepID=A0A2P5VZD4_GOSBA|nr:hypothetical protein GOBAR_AA36517 [Gossypium barbadense]
MYPLSTKLVIEVKPSKSFTSNGDPQNHLPPYPILIARDRKAVAQLIQRLLFDFLPKSDTDLDSYLLGDKTILKDTRLEGLKDVEALSPPPENGSAQKYPGDKLDFPSKTCHTVRKWPCRQHMHQQTDRVDQAKTRSSRAKCYCHSL